MLGAATKKNYFELFELPVEFDVDLATLGARYRELAKRVHPDRFAQASDQERRLSMQWTTLANEAFQTLKDPIRRGRYLLSLRDAKLGDDTDTQMDPQFLMEQMELREELDALRAAAAPRSELVALTERVRRRFAQKTGEFRGLLAAGEAAHGQAVNAIREMQFLDKLLRQLGDLEEDLG